MSADYQFQIPKTFSYPFVGALVSIVAALLSYNILSKFGWLSIAVAGIFLVLGSIYVAMCLFIRRFTNLERRLKARNLLIDEIPWRGDESVLDVGCGNGILILEAAKHLNNGKAIGIDIWTEGSGDNNILTFKKNAEIEGVSEKVDIQNLDARDLPYKDSSFDVVLCGLTMHHLLHDKGADKAISEMVRVLKPGGYIAIYDVPIAIYSTTKLLCNEGLASEKINSNILIGRKSQH